MRISLGLSAEHIDDRISSIFCGVGLVRGEYVFRRAHQYVTTAAGQQALSSYLRQVAEVFAPLPVWYRTSELESDEAMVLEGCDDQSIVDAVPALGTRGVRRAQLHPETFALELSVFRTASTACQNLGLMFPFVATPEEARWAKDTAARMGIRTKMGCMIEIPSAAIAVDEILSLGFTRLVIGVNDLNCLLLGAPRGSTRYPKLSLALQKVIRSLVTSTQDRNAELAIAGYLDTRMIEFARSSGLDECILHYSQLPELLGTEFANLPELSTLREIKQWTRRAIEQRKVQRCSQPAPSCT